MLLEDEVRDASEVRQRWAHYLNLVEAGTPVTVTRRAHEPATLVNRRRFQDLLTCNEELVEVVEILNMMIDHEALGALEGAEKAILRGEGLSFAAAFGEELRTGAKPGEAYEPVIAPTLLDEIGSLGIVAPAREAIREAVTPPVRRPTVAPTLFRGLSVGRYRILYRVIEAPVGYGARGPGEVRFLYAGKSRLLVI